DPEKHRHNKGPVGALGRYRSAVIDRSKKAFQFVRSVDVCVIFFRMPCQSMGRYIGRYPHAAEIFAEYTEAADPVGMIRCTFIAAFLAPMIAEFLGKPLFGKL